MKVLDIVIKQSLNIAKSKTNAIEEINKTVLKALTVLSTENPERYRYWYNKFKKIHPLVDQYMSGQFVSSEISDTVGEHILNVNSDTQKVDLKYYFEKINNNQDNNLLPMPVRNSIRNKLNYNQLSMIENSYNKLNEKYAYTISTNFPTSNYNQWIISRVAAHNYYNTPDYNGFSVKLLLYDLRMQTLLSKYSYKINLLNNIVPIEESIIVDNEVFYVEAEGKNVMVNLFLNKVINMPKEIDNGIFNPKELT